MTEEDTFRALKKPDYITMRDMYMKWKADNFTNEYTTGNQRPYFILQSHKFFESYGWKRSEFFGEASGRAVRKAKQESS